MMNTQYQEEGLVIWRLTDGKPGHEKQSLGLVSALRKKTVVDCYDIPVKPDVFAWINYIASLWPQGNRLPRPDYIIGAGHHTHLHILAAKRAFGGQSIVLMKPSVSASLFDYALIPSHDAYKGLGNVIETRGVLNPMQSKGEHDSKHVLLLIGGPSKHYGWQNSKVIDQVRSLVTQQPEKQFTLTTSRRTPKDFVLALSETNMPRLTIVPVEETGNGWVEKQLAKAGSAWITEDSVSMVYEALTAQVAVGLMSVDKLKESRVAKGVMQLIKNNMVVRFDQQGKYLDNMRALIGFQEADRCAALVFAQPVLQGQHTQPQAV